MAKFTQQNGELTITNLDGSNKRFSVLFTFDIKEDEKGYIVYTDYEKNETGGVKVYAGCYRTNANSDELYPVSDKETLKFIESYLKDK